MTKSKLPLLITGLLFAFLGCETEPERLSESSSAKHVVAYLGQNTEFQDINLTIDEGTGKFSGTCNFRDIAMKLTVTIEDSKINWEASQGYQESVGSDGSTRRTGGATVSGYRTL